ncbi:MAG: cupin domain-containing protein [Clostridia bacterium]|nr:cupin domain-containing protein [Clostridia bacterium]
MKCFVLAGGTGDRLWPLSRKEYPKQFTEIREHRSLFQETILRNIPFCDEYVIMANRLYENIIKGQLKPFHRVKYTLIFEEEEAVRGTALPITMALMRCKKDEEVMIVASDFVPEGDYNGTILALKEVVAKDKIGVVATLPINKQCGYNYVEYRGNRILSFSKSGLGDKDYLWECGISAGKASVYLQAIESNFLKRTQERFSLFSGVITKEIATGYSRTSFSPLLNVDYLQLVRAKFIYHRITDLQTYNDYKGKKEKDSTTIKFSSKNVDVINMEDGKSVVVNNLDDLIVVNTRDALYISKHTNVADIKTIIQQNYANYPQLFDQSSTVYENWGVKETLYYMVGYRFLKITVYEGKEIPTHVNTQHTEIIMVASGKDMITIAGNKQEYSKHQSAFFPLGVKYRIENIGEGELVLMVTRMGEGLMSEREGHPADETLVKLTPHLQECLWGGSDIGKVFGKDLGGRKNIGESWELSTHPAGESRIADGKYAGKTLRQFIDIIGKEKIGWKAQAFAEFPLLIKFIDAHDSLSIQVHPNDEYAFPNENQYGKNEMWYIVSAKPGAYIYAGFNCNVTRDEVEHRVADGTLERVLQKIPVQAGETYFLKAGTVHAIGKGCLICEIQQSSNVTYRLYDYNRKDKRGNQRALHVAKALDVLNFKESTQEFIQQMNVEDYGGGTRTLLGECKYFSAVKYEAQKTLNVAAGYSSFVAFVVLEGKGEVTTGDEISRKTFKKGDTFFGVAQSYLFKSRGKISIIAVML